MLAVSAVCAFTLPPEQSTGAPDWAFGVVGWHALFLLADLRVKAYAAFLGAHVLFNAAAVFLFGAPTVTQWTVMGISTTASCGFQLSVAVLMSHLLQGTAPASGDRGCAGGGTAYPGTHPRGHAA